MNTGTCHIPAVNSTAAENKQQKNGHQHQFDSVKALYFQGRYWQVQEKNMVRLFIILYWGTNDSFVVRVAGGDCIKVQIWSKPAEGKSRQRKAGTKTRLRLE